ncbi:hypothetical protein JG688_00001135, partial [Phytophthora aleatoria]
MVSIVSIKARQIFDSRGNPTVEVDLVTELGEYRAAVPSGASTGEFEALEMRDGGKDYMGKGVLNAVRNVNEIIAPALIGKDVTKQAEIDRFMVEELDGTQNEWGWCKKKLGANAILGVSLALCRAGAAAKKQPLWQHIADLAGNPTPCLPVPSFNIINGGSHAGNKLAMQEFMILPVGATSFTEAMKIGSEVYHNLKKVIKGRYGLDATAVGDEGGFAPNIQSNGEAIDLIEEAIKAAGYTDKVRLGMDVAASEFYTGAEDARYNLDFKNENAADSEKISADKLQEARQIFDSRGNPTVEVDLVTELGEYRAAVPSGASTGEFEALEMRDGGKDYMGKGVLNAVRNVNEIIAPALIGKDVTKQAEIDRFMVEELDGTQNEWGWCKKKLGANAILGVSLALCRAGAAAKKQPLWQHIADLAGNPTPCLPVPSFNIINGGSHAGNKLAMQEFMILPVGATSFTEAMKIGSEVYHNLKKVIKGRYGLDATAVGDEGGFAPNIQSNGEAIDLIEEAIKAAGYTDKVRLGMDVAASEFYTGAEDARYNLDFKNENAADSEKISADKLQE